MQKTLSANFLENKLPFIFLLTHNHVERYEKSPAPSGAWKAGMIVSCMLEIKTCIHEILVYWNIIRGSRHQWLL